MHIILYLAKNEVDKQRNEMVYYIILQCAKDATFNVSTGIYWHFNALLDICLQKKITVFMHFRHNVRFMSI